MYLDLDLNETLGPALIGTIFALMHVISSMVASKVLRDVHRLFGLSCAQVMYYVCEYPKDKLLLKGLVTGCRLLDTGATIVDTVIVWHYTVTSRNNVFDLAKLFNYYIYTIWIFYQFLVTVGSPFYGKRLVQKLTIYAVNRGGLITVVQTTQFITGQVHRTAEEFTLLGNFSPSWQQECRWVDVVYFNSFLAVQVFSQLHRRSI
ncbi:hypothetical protein POSPLADRAFT_1154385 [Postia placenta MAD-698-R-SB12]|uniref:Uncharacterized protein n=1 Tax=Postia placenta MAD-698-R-SB12 TaxID=670580 RepID=A0A1X6MPW3_9APHY|nr:hypothetical protein POSPLADRAFT_1154385 [Postia placenta MAD-698-R-SB12]OSX58232.1 hypothetical protein POSPLADRAFT_1154385 [Postia placenta MAD-698-R-SB12]